MSNHELARGDLYLLCSDGLWGTVPDVDLANRHGGDRATWRRAAERLIDAANAAGGPDNITALLVRIS